ncbi:translation initiation factor eIF2B subunit delta-like [Watersipora subatra]|uniref:translation initiation factor eIF2B subunit delta-like n=1 Tax=Watersipora subatra TaxID=2589382 RepID=UPI00355BC9DB
MADKDSSSKKADKKARRAAKVAQKGDGESTDNRQSVPAGAPIKDAKLVKQKDLSIASTLSTATTTVSPNKTTEVQDAGLASAERPAPQIEASTKVHLSKAERRALQEAQRQAKLEKNKEVAVKNTSDGAQASSKKANTSPTPATDSSDPKRKQGSKNAKLPGQLKSSSSKFFAHLPAYRSEAPNSKSDIHPCIAQIGLQYCQGIICGSNARAVALLCAFKKVVEDYETPNQKDLARDLQAKLKLYMNYLGKCRPVSVSMESVSKYISPIVLGCSGTESEAKAHLSSELDRFYHERIKSSDEEIANKCLEKIVPGDVILTYGHSSLVLKVLVTAIKKYSNVSVVVVDSRPKLEGKEMVRKLLKACPSASCSYALINSISYIMPKASKVLLGAHAVLANGYIMSRVGTSHIALMAKAYNVPLLVCCETYKFSHRMQTDSFVANELGDETPMVHINGRPGPLAPLISQANLHVLNLCYDVTPPEYVAGLITESGVIPCTSAPVVIRVKQQYDLNLLT